jgi:hypothetical protein
LATIRLTAGRIRDFSLHENKKQEFLWDDAAPGFGVRATARRKAFFFESRLNGKKLRLTIGDTRSWGIDKARTEARRLQTLLDQGIDPRQAKAETLAATEAKREEPRRQDATMGEIWPLYVEDRRPHWSERHHRDHVNLARPGGEKAKRGNKAISAGPLAPLMPITIKELTASSVRG